MKIIIEDKNVDLESRCVETIYLVNIEEYLAKTGLSKEQLIQHTQAEIKMLEEARVRYGVAYRELKPLDFRSTDLSKLIGDIEKRISAKERKLKKYKEIYE